MAAGWPIAMIYPCFEMGRLRGSPTPGMPNGQPMLTN